VTLSALRPGWRTDFILHHFDAEVLERSDCIVVRTPSNPTYYWGNCLHLPSLPGDGELAHWLARFDEEIGARQPAWLAAGFECIVEQMLHLPRTALRAPARAAHGTWRLRLLDLPRDSDALMQVEMTDAGGFEPTGYRSYLRQQHARFAALQAAGQLQWFGIECDGVLAATCGLIRSQAGAGADGRFQRVVTHSQWRRRGLASALGHGVSRFAHEQWQVGALYMAADPDDVAVGLYRALGFVDLSLGAGLQRKAPRDRVVAGAPPA
jgi:ribosomal protein S18 acetylase RimI-like enzyme